jgi:hypothetical protein
VCRSDQPQAALQKTIDYACGAGADCNFIHEQGPCYNPNTVVAHCSWAANSYFQRKRGTGATCDFTGTATLTTTDPSKGHFCFLLLHSGSRIHLLALCNCMDEHSFELWGLEIFGLRAYKSMHFNILGRFH